jgi:hypothetical protein
MVGRQANRDLFCHLASARVEPVQDSVLSDGPYETSGDNRRSTTDS